jgi:hypothetical protein
MGFTNGSAVAPRLPSGITQSKVRLKILRAHSCGFLSLRPRDTLPPHKHMYVPLGLWICGSPQLRTRNSGVWFSAGLVLFSVVRKAVGRSSSACVQAFARVRKCLGRWRLTLSTCEKNLEVDLEREQDQCPVLSSKETAWAEVAGPSKRGTGKQWRGICSGQTHASLQGGLSTASRSAHILQDVFLILSILSAR